MKNLLLLISLSLVKILPAQTAEAVQAAFTKSYILEIGKQYEKAANEIKIIYQNQSYEQNLRLGWLMYEAGKYIDALSYYRNAIKLKPSSIEAKLGIVYPLSAQNNWDEVFEQYRQVLLIDPHNSTANYRSGLIMYNRKKYTEAKLYFQTMLQLYPFDYDLNHMMGWTYLKLNKKPEAKTYFEKALLYSPNDKSSKEGLALSK